jgi:hypothetical protein
MLAGLFIAQLVLGGVLRAGLHAAAAGELELTLFSGLYVVLSLVFLYRARRVLRLLWRKGRAKKKACGDSPAR